MNLTAFAHNVGLALEHAGAIEADAQMVRWAIERDALAEYVAATTVARIAASTPHDSPLAMAGFRPVVIDGALAYGHQTTSGRLTVDLFPEAGTATLRFESASGHILSVHLLFAGGDVFASIEAGDLSLLEGRPDRLDLLGRIDRHCGGRIRAALESAEPDLGGADGGGISRVLDALDAEAAHV